jgi:hypothetical protein
MNVVRVGDVVHFGGITWPATEFSLMDVVFIKYLKPTLKRQFSMYCILSASLISSNKIVYQKFRHYQSSGDHNRTSVDACEYEVEEQRNELLTKQKRSMLIR